MIDPAKLIPLARQSLNAAEALVEEARSNLRRRVGDGQIDNAALEREQFAAHGLAWYATYATALRQMLDWAERLETAGRFGERESLILQGAFGEYLAQMAGGLAMSQGEIVRPSDLGIESAAAALRADPAAAELMGAGNSAAVRQRLARLIADGEFGETVLGDDSLAMIREQFHRFAEGQREAAQRWHREDELIPMAVIEELAGLGIFGLTVPEAHGGLGLGKLAMCVVTEELSRGYIGLGSLGTRSEIAAELIRLGGTEAQKKKWLPGLASGAILPTAVFTEPGTGSDLGSLRPAPNATAMSIALPAARPGSPMPRAAM